MMPLEKWLKLLLLIIILVSMLKCISLFGDGNNNKIVLMDDKTDNKSNEKCTSCDKILPVLEPRFNMREICKQTILLEDHLFQEEKRCQDCIYKHFLTIEALAEEAITLDKENKHPELKELPTKIRAIEKKYIANPKDAHLIAQELREIRKQNMTKCFDAF